MGKNTPSAGKGWRDRGHSQEYRDGHDRIFGKKKKRTWREVQEEAWREVWRQRPDLKGD